MKFIIDEQLPPLLAVWLRECGHEAIHVRDAGLAAAPDRAIRDMAAEAVIITKDEDFTRIRRPTDGQVLWLRGGNLNRSLFMQRLKEAWPEAHRRLQDGEPLVETVLTP